MAEFCNICAPQYGFEADFDINRIALTLKPGQQESVICEGCALIAIAKTTTGTIKLMYQKTPPMKRSKEGSG